MKPRSWWFYLAVFLLGFPGVMLALIPANGSPQACALPSADIVGWWPAEATANDIAGSNDGVIEGAAFAPGMVGQAFSLDDENDYVHINDAVSLDSQSQLTLEAWIRPDTLGWPNPDPDSDYEASIITKYDSRESGKRSYVFALTDGHLKMAVFGQGGVFQAIADESIAIDAWSHVAGVWDGSSISLYVDGAIVTSTVTGSTISQINDNNTPVNIGRVESYSGSYTGPAAYFDGLIDETSLYARALSASEVADIFDAGSDGKCPDSSPATPTSSPTPTSTPTMEPNSPAHLPVILKSLPPTPTPTPTLTPTPLPDWLGHVNSLRQMATLPNLTENTDWSHGCWLHARYAVKNDATGHTEDPSLPWYTPEGLACAQSANLSYSYNVDRSDLAALDGLMTAPFHGVGMIDPALLQSGFGSYREADGGLQHVVALDVIRGLGSIPGSVSFPIMWPGQDATTPLAHFDGNEHPDPLTSCPGYVGPTGAPIILQIGSGNLTPDVTHVSVTHAGTVVHNCVFDETDYYNPDPGDQSLGRAILNSRDAIVIIPRYPLVPSGQYYVSVTTNGESYSWSFSVAESPRAYGPARTGEPELID